jgi:CRISPR-associated protein Cmr6
VTGALGSRMIVGLGGGSVFETAITLHHTYGFPYIPGSAVKGCLRSFVIRDLFGGDEQAALADEDFVKAFGSQERRGGVVFLDALPTRCDKLELDIMNPHYAEYYQGKCAPTDDKSPTPIKFYAVPKDTQFTFRLASGTFDIKRAAIKDVPLTALLETTLSEIGVGAKTAVGYGWFRDIKEVIV